MIQSIWGKKNLWVQAIFWLKKRNKNTPIALFGLSGSFNFWPSAEVKKKNYKKLMESTFISWLGKESLKFLSRTGQTWQQTTKRDKTQQ